jgi:putative ABC transport system ATP-binding protein
MALQTVPAFHAPESGPVSPILIAEEVTKSFREGRQTTAVLRGIDFAMRPGEVVAMEGPSGSGKTTLLSILGCILTPTSGRVVVDGNDIDARHPERLPEIRRRSIGFVFQQYNLFPSLNALENVEYALAIKGMSAGNIRAQAKDALLRVGLEDRLRYLPRDLSGGQKQRVAIARALAGRPRILLADEPTANLDSAVGRDILQLFCNLAKDEGRALLIVTHDPQVREVADRVVQIRDGRLIA